MAPAAPQQGASLASRRFSAPSPELACLSLRDQMGSPPNLALAAATRGGFGRRWPSARRAMIWMRAHPDLNQGPADLQSAALATELCTHWDCRGRPQYFFPGSNAQEHARGTRALCGCACVRAPLGLALPTHKGLVGEPWGLSETSTCRPTKLSLAALSIWQWP